MNIFFSFLIVISFNVEASELSELYKKFDTDHDKKITVDDKIPPQEKFKYSGGFEVQGTYYLSNLAQELKLSEKKSSKVQKKFVFENPVDRISRSIRERYWDGLTRKIDKGSLSVVIQDTKVEAPKDYLFLSPTDKDGISYYKNLKSKKIEVKILPSEIRKGFITQLKGQQGLLGLALEGDNGVPYVVPGGRFNEMYGWDSYFHVLGTLQDGRIDLAKGMVTNFIFEIEHYGKILNANRTYYLSRSQPPFFTSMLKEVYTRLPKNNDTKKWFTRALRAALKEYKDVWMGQDRLTATGLSRYAGFDQGIPPEVEEGHFDHELLGFAKKHKISLQDLKKGFDAGVLKDSEMTNLFNHDRAVRESGHDTTYRWTIDGKNRASDFVTVDLNSLLYRYEKDLETFIKNEFKGEFEGVTSKSLALAAQKRKKLIRQYLWNEKEGIFFDYNFKTQKPSDYLSATTLYPLWAGDILTAEESKSLVKNALKALEMGGGISATSEESLKKYGDPQVERQWEYPNGWPPHQMLAWKGLLDYGYKEEAERLIYKWLMMITTNARDYNGTIPEKFNVVTQSHKVFAEYGNVGTKFSYITNEGFGWMNASYQLGLKYLSKEKIKALKQNATLDQSHSGTPD